MFLEHGDTKQNTHSLGMFTHKIAGLERAVIFCSKSLWRGSTGQITERQIPAEVEFPHSLTPFVSKYILSLLGLEILDVTAMGNQLCFPKVISIMKNGIIIQYHERIMKSVIVIKSTVVIAQRCCNLKAWKGKTGVEEEVQGITDKR